MQRDEFVNKLSRYSKEAILNGIYRECFFKHERLIEEIKITERDIEFKKLSKRSEELMTEMKKLQPVNTYEKLASFHKLMNEDRIVEKKIDKLLKTKGE